MTLSLTCDIKVEGCKTLVDEPFLIPKPHNALGYQNIAHRFDKSRYSRRAAETTSKIFGKEGSQSTNFYARNGIPNSLSHAPMSEYTLITMPTPFPAGHAPRFSITYEDQILFMRGDAHTQTRFLVII